MPRLTRLGMLLGARGWKLSGPTVGCSCLAGGLVVWLFDGATAPGVSGAVVLFVSCFVLEGAAVFGSQVFGPPFLAGVDAADTEGYGEGDACCQESGPAYVFGDLADSYQIEGGE